MPNGHTYLCRLAAAKARFDNRHSISAPAPTFTAVSGSGARGTSDPRTDNDTRRTNSARSAPPNLHDPPRAKGSLDRRSKRLSFPHFFLRRKKCGRRRPPPRQGETDSPPQRQGLFRAPGAGTCLRRVTFVNSDKSDQKRRQKLRFCTSSARYACSPLSVFPHVTGVFLIVVVPPTVPAQLSAAAACYYGKNYSFCRVAG